MHREIKSLSHFFGITTQRREQGGRGSEEASTHTSHITQHHPTSPYFFFHLSTMSIIAALSFGGCILARSPDTNLTPPPFYPPHHGLLLCKLISTPARNQLFCAASAPFKAFDRCPAFVPLGRAFE
jgi:hypothetical protein